MIADMRGISAIEVIPGRSAIKELGYDSDYERKGNIFLPNPKVWRKAAREGEIAYRYLKQGAKAEVLIAAFDVDSNGLCKQDMILEIFYRDDIKQKIPKINRVEGRVRIESQIDFVKDNQYVEVGNLTAIGDRKWKHERIFLERTPRQMIRAIDGVFHFKIIMPSAGSTALPVSYIRLVSIDHQEFVRLREKDRVKRGLKRIEYKPTADKISSDFKINNQPFVVYPVNYLKLVFPNSPIEYERVNEPLKCFEIPGHEEPVSFVIHAFENLSNLQVKVSELRAGANSISAEMISVRKVVYNDQRWLWGWTTQYGTCPDYLSKENPMTDMEANTNSQIWLTVSVPESTSPGLYKGKVDLYTNYKHAQSIPLSVEVLPVRLFPNRVKHFIYHDPRMRDFHRDPIAVLKDMKRHGLIPIVYPRAKIIETGSGPDVNMDGFETQLQELRSIYPDAEELFIVVYNCYEFWQRLGGDKPEFTTRLADFEKVYGKILKKYADMGKSYKFELYVSFHDEPFVDLRKRRASYICSRIAQSIGLKTWAAHRLDYDFQLKLTERERIAKINYLRPLREVLDVFADIIIRIDKKWVNTFRNGQGRPSYYTTFLATSVRPLYNRILHGIFSNSIDSQFVLCYAYRDSLVDPYDDMDRKAIYSEISMNDYLLTYPTWEGDILPTLSYESLREGVEDSELISTLQVLSEKALLSKDTNTMKLGKEAERYLDDILTRVNLNFKQRDKSMDSAGSPIDSLEQALLRDLDINGNESYGIFDKIRRGFCDRIITLQQEFGIIRNNDVYLPRDH